MTEIRKLWTEELPPVPEAELALIGESADPMLAEAAGCFWLFRLLHRRESPRCVLMGDYCFARFSHHLALLDSVELNNAFSAYLKNDVLCEGDFYDFLSFLKGLR